ncbi:MAG: AMP-binding protein [Gammaproteobacteria bacterium]
MSPGDSHHAASFATLNDLVATFAARGNRTAIVAFQPDGVDELSYAALGERIAHIAHGLRVHGLSPGERVALWAANSPDWIAAYFGIVTAGGVAVPLDHQSTADSVATAIAHADVRIMITAAARSAELQPLTKLTADNFVHFDGDGPHDLPALSAAPLGAELPRADPHSVASLLFTSGTTGTPKAVPLTHANLAANVAELKVARLIGSEARVLLPLPLHHTYPFTVGLLVPLAAGATVILPSGISGPEISRATTTAHATALLAVPRLCTALWDSVASAVQTRGRAARAIFKILLTASIAVRRVTGLHIGRWLFGAVHARLGPALTLIGCGGAKLPAELTFNLEGLGWTVLTGYGLTETSPVLTFNSPAESRLGSEGRPLPGVELRIAAPAAEEKHGEIEARGPSVFRGYWHNDDATATAFTTDGWFKTGDLGRFDAGGYLYVVGRNKELIVLPDGKKLFPEPVEKLYAASPLIHELGIFEHGGVLAALVVLDERAARERGAMRAAELLREEIENTAARLPPYQRLRSYRVTREPLPRTQLGKLKRHLLPALFDEAAHPTRTAAAEPSDADRALLEKERAAAAWRWLRERYSDRMLTLDTSPQLDLQIDSLQWVTLTIEIERLFGVTLTGDALSRILTIRDLLHEIDSASAATPGTAAQLPSYSPPGPLLSGLGAIVLAVVRLVVRTGWGVRVEGAENLPKDGPLLFTPNHTSYLDAGTMIAALPWRQLRRTYWAGWSGVMYSSALRGLISRSARVFPVDPDRDPTGAMRTARDLLSCGNSVVWFPEGWRSPTGELQPFQTGVGVLLQGGAVTAIPAAIFGAFAAWPRHERWPHFTPVRVVFGAPQRFADGESPEAIREALERAVRQLLAAGAPGEDPSR